MNCERYKLADGRSIFKDSYGRWFLVEHVCHWVSFQELEVEDITL